MRMQIDEAGRDDEAVGVDHLFGKAGSAAAKLRNLPVLDPHVAAIARDPGTIDDRAAFDLNVVISHEVFPPRVVRTGVPKFVVFMSLLTLVTRISLPAPAH